MSQRLSRAAAVGTLLLTLSCRGEAPAPRSTPPPVTPAPRSPPSTPVPSPAQPSDVTAEDYRMPRLPTAQVFVASSTGAQVPFTVEVAATRDARTRGLMWRYALPEGTGMLFIFPRDLPLSFWMRNTLIPLDMLFIDGAGRVVNVIENAEPRTLQSRPSAGPATYVLEVAGGTCAKKGIKAGAKVRFEGISTIIPEE